MTELPGVPAQDELERAERFVAKMKALGAVDVTIGDVRVTFGHGLAPQTLIPPVKAEPELTAQERAEEERRITYLHVEDEEDEEGAGDE